MAKIDDATIEDVKDYEMTESALISPDGAGQDEGEITIQEDKLTKTLSEEKLSLISTILSNKQDLTNEELMSIVTLIIESDEQQANEDLRFNQEVVTNLHEPETDSSIVEEPEEPLQNHPVSIVLVGKDTRKKGKSLNTDVIMVLVLQPDKRTITLLSLPRDLGVKIPGYQGLQKINSAYAKGEIARIKGSQKGTPPNISGATLLKETIGDYLGIPIQYYMAIDFEGFVEVINQLGGVEVNVDRRLLYHDPTDGTKIDLQPGLQVLDGQRALDFVRHRHDDRGSKYFSSDFQRNTRQQEVIKAITKKVSSAGLTKLMSFLDIAGKNVRTDIPPDLMLTLIKSYIGFRADDIVVLPNNANWNRKTSLSVIPDSQLELIRIRLQEDFKGKTKQ